MRARDLIHLVGSNLKRMKVRLALTALGVVIGTASIVLMISLGNGLQHNVTQSLGAIGAATHITVIGKGGQTGSGMPEAMDRASVDELSDLEHVDAASPSLMVMTLQGATYKRMDGVLNLEGVRMKSFQLLGYDLAEGRYPRSDDEILLGASSLTFEDPRGRLSKLEPRDLVGKRIALLVADPIDEEALKSGAVEDLKSQEPQVRKEKVTVVGVLKKADMQVDQTAYVPMAAALKFNGTPERKAVYDAVIVKADAPSVVTDVEKIIVDRGYIAFSAASIQEQMKSLFMIIQGVLAALGAISMLVASIGIANTMTMSIFERTREIGIMKAVGASKRQIKRVFLGEAAVIGVLGGLGGLLLSISGAALANLFANSMIASQTAQAGGITPGDSSFFIITPELAVFAVAFAAGVGLLAGVLPAVRAANLDPLTALRHE